MQSQYLQGETVETIYFGGGTPSLLEPDELRSILTKLRFSFPTTPDPEITLEANPDDITPEKLNVWKDAGINRLSIGVQSFFEEHLLWMNRAHHAGQALQSIRDAQLAGFDNITIDLIYGIPELTNEQWKQNVDQALALGVPHLSCYALTVEPKTPLYKMIRKKEAFDVDPDEQAVQFSMLAEWLGEAGYEHYEISNFAKPGKRSRHNSSYWSGQSYLGLGPSAHSFNGSVRQWNLADTGKYIRSLQNGKLLFEHEELSATQQLNEYIMISLRTIEGCDLEKVKSRFGMAQADRILAESEGYRKTGKMKLADGHLVLTGAGKFLADGIASALFA